MPHQRLSRALVAAVLLFVYWRRFHALGSERPLKLSRLWVIPAVYMALAAYLMLAMPPTLQGWGYAAIGLLVGLALGWQRGKLMHITLHPDTQALTQKASPAAMIFLVVLVVLSLGRRMLMGSGASSGRLEPQDMMLIDSLVAFAAGMFVAQGLNMYLRAKRLLTGKA